MDTEFEAEAKKQGYDEGLREGLEKGHDRGIAEGFKIARNWEKRAMDMGLSKGLMNGLAQGQKGLFLMLLKEKFGKLPARELKRLGSLGEGRAEKLAIKLLTAQSIEEIFETE